MTVFPLTRPQSFVAARGGVITDDKSDDNKLFALEGNKHHPLQTHVKIPLANLITCL